MSAVVPPLRHRVGRSLSWPPSCAAFHPRRQVHDCPATPLSPPEFSTSLTLFAGLWFTAFSPFHLLATAGCRSLGNHWLSLQPPLRPHLLGELLGEPTRSSYLRLVPHWPRLAYSFAPPRRDELLTSTLPGLIGTSYPPLRCLDSSTSPLVPTPSLHLRTVAGALAT